MSQLAISGRSRGQEILWSLALVGMLTLVAAAGLRTHVVSSMLASVSAQEPPALREFTLTAEEIDWQLAPGTTVRAWAYNGQMPGPELRVREGDTVRITLVNRLPVGTTIHWHGVDVPPAMDGPVGLNQAAVKPGETFVYEFTATNPGSRMYHAHADPTMQIALGL